MDNKSKLNTVLLVIIIILLVGGLVYIFFNNSKKENKIRVDSVPLQNQGNLPVVNNNQQNTNITPNKDDHTYISNTYGYSIEYSGIDTKNVYVENDGKKINLFSNQSQIDNLEVVDSSYVVANYISSVGTVTFGTNMYKKFKDNVIPRHTYYFKSGLKNGKAIFISVENDSDNPAYFDLASLKIN